jgi:DNA-binding NtrC family response regulator
MTAHGTSGNAITAIQLGAYDFISKPLDLDEIVTTADRTLAHARLQNEVEELRGELQKNSKRNQGEIVGSSRAMLEVFKDIGRVAGDTTQQWIDTLVRLPLHESVAEWEKYRISKALDESNGNKTQAARRLNVHRRLLYEKMRKLGINPSDELSQEPE